MPSDINSILSLPFETLVVLACGYLGYRLAYVGRDAKHRAIDTFMLVLVFASLAKGAFVLAEPCSHKFVGPIFAPLMTISTAMFWRRFGQGWVFAALRMAKVSHHDGYSTVWQSIVGRELPNGANRIVVHLKNGQQLMCAETYYFNKAPFGPYLLGEDGSVAMYVTDVRADGNAEWVELTPYDPERADFGYELTSIPADQIKFVDIHLPN